MNRWILGAACAATVIALGWTAAPSACAQETKTTGEWVSLFNGKSLDGWVMNPLGRNSTSKWEVVDGALTGSGTASMLACTKGPYKNFRYRVEAKINDRGNSGMYVHCPTTKPGFTDGYEIQIDSTHADPIRTGSIYTMVHIFDQLVPPDTWFTQEVEVIVKDYRGKVLPHFRVWVNGKLLYQYIDHSKQFPEPGYFAFQQHDPGSKVQIRKVEVMELP
jgi:hypothetical protein